MADYESREQYVKELEGKLAAFETVFGNILFQLDDLGKQQMVKAITDSLNNMPTLAAGDPAFHRGFLDVIDQIRSHMQ